MQRTSRRTFLVRSAVAGGALSLSSLFRPRMVIAQSMGSASTTGVGRYFIHIVQNGGGCGLSLCPPAEVATFAALQTRRPNLMKYDASGSAYSTTPIAYSLSDIAIAGQSGAPYGLHPYFKRSAWAGVATVHDQFVAGKGRIIAGAGKPALDGSHDSAMKQLLTGTNTWNGGLAKHWLAQLVDKYEMPVDSVWALGYQLPSVPLSTDRPSPIILNRISDYDYFRWNDQLGGTAAADAASTLARGLVQDEDPATLTPAGQKLRTAVLHAFESRDSTVLRTPAPTRTEWRDGSAGGVFEDAVKIIRYAESTGNTQSMIIRIGIDGFDTHGSQRGQMDAWAGYFNRSIGLMMADLGSIMSKTAILMETEFGRTINENSLGADNIIPDARGTDHGWSNNHLMFSGGFRSATPIVVGGPASVQELTNSTTISRKVDWRLPIAETLAWLGFNPNDAFPGIDMSTTLRLFS